MSSWVAGFVVGMVWVCLVVLCVGLLFCDFLWLDLFVGLLLAVNSVDFIVSLLVFGVAMLCRFALVGFGC